MGDKISGLILYCFNLKKRFILTWIVSVLFIYKFTISDYQNEGLIQLQSSANLFGFLFVYLIAVFGNNFFNVNETDSGFKMFLNNIGNGFKSYVLTKYLTDLVLLAVDIVIVSGTIAFILLKVDVGISVSFFYGVICAAELVLLNTGIDNLIKLVYNKKIYKVILLLVISVVFVISCVLIVNYGSKIHINSVVISIFTVLNIALYALFCFIAEKKISGMKVEDLI